MVERTLKEAVDMEDYKDWDAGKPRRRKPKLVIPQPESPQVKDRLTMDTITLDDVTSVLECKRENILNKDRVRFMGFRVAFMAKGKKVSGWMPEADYIEFRRLLFRAGMVNVDNMEF